MPFMYDSPLEIATSSIAAGNAGSAGGGSLVTGSKLAGMSGGVFGNPGFCAQANASAATTAIGTKRCVGKSEPRGGDGAVYGRVAIVRRA